MGILQVGAIVRALPPPLYQRGPDYGTEYRIESVYGPCDCPRYSDVINCRPGEEPPPSEPHYHAIGRHPVSGAKGYLGGHRPDGTSVWGIGDLILVSEPPPPPIGTQFALPGMTKTERRRKHG